MLFNISVAKYIKYFIPSLPEHLSSLLSWLPSDILESIFETWKLTLQYSHHWKPDELNVNMLSITRTIVTLLDTQGKHAVYHLDNLQAYSVVLLY
jgi:hypothetical protein